MQGQDDILDERSLDISDSFSQDLANNFEYASGSIIGRNHVLAGKNNQDAYQIVANDKFIVAVVCDGCGSGKHSEVGAKLGAKLVIEEICKLLNSALNQEINQDLEISNTEFWSLIKVNLLQKLQNLLVIATRDKESVSVGAIHELPLQMEFVNDYLLFTIVGAVITPTETITFSMGDGAIAINGELNQIPAYPDNAPPYLAYGLYRPDSIDFEIRDRLPTPKLESLLIATDGIDDLVKVEDIHQFWQEDRYFKNPDAIRRKLAMLNREEVKPDWQKRELNRRSGVLSDDTSLIVIRRLLAISY